MARTKTEDTNSANVQDSFKEQGESSDLITLADSNNASFELEDFDPLNQNARPLPTFLQQKRKSTTLPAKTNPPQAQFTISGHNVSKMQSSLYANFSPQHAYKQQGVRATATTTTSETQTKLPTIRPPRPPRPENVIQRPPPLPKTLPPPMPPQGVDTDFELLRKYGLDQFTLTTTTTPESKGLSTTTDSIVMNNKKTTTVTAARSNWTTFD